MKEKEQQLFPRRMRHLPSTISHAPLIMLSFAIHHPPFTINHFSQHG
jgi:hypothetical protein